MLRVNRLAVFLLLTLMFLLIAPLGASLHQDSRLSAAESVYAHPWEKSPDFQKAASSAGVHVRMSSFSATLRDPLPGELNNVAHAAKLLSGTVIQPGETFSQNGQLGPYTLNKGYLKGPTYSGNRVITTVGGGVCKIASVLYNNARLSNMQIVERHNHSLTVPYVPPGQDATVYYGSRDIKFRNTTGGPVLLWASLYGKTLRMAFYGHQVSPKVTWHHETLKTLKSHTVYQYNPNLARDVEKVAAPGQDGVIVRSWITVRYFNGSEIRKDLGRNYYAPSPRIIERGLKR